MIISAGSHIVLILLFIFLVAWRAPNPPLPEFGIELNFGTSDVGTGDIQPETTAAETETEEEAAPDTAEEIEEEIVEETITDASEEAQEAVVETTETQEDIIPVTDTPTEDPVKDPIEKTEEKKLPTAEPVEAEEKKEEPTPPKVLYPGTKEGAAGTTGDSKNPAAANQGGKTDTVGDEGDEKGTVDGRSQYPGTVGAGGGSVLDMDGWVWDKEPRPDHGDIEFAGTIEFEITIDEKGDIISVLPKKWTVSTSLMRLYQRAVEATTYDNISGRMAPQRSKGKITFTIKAKAK